jgi:hypothetical protein
VLKLENGRLVDGDDPLAGQAVGRFGGQNAREGSANHRPPAARVPLPASVGDVVHAPADPPQPMLVSE